MSRKTPDKRKLNAKPTSVKLTYVKPTNVKPTIVKSSNVNPTNRKPLRTVPFENGFHFYTHWKVYWNNRNQSQRVRP